MKTDIDYKKGVLFVRVNGSLTGNKIKEFENEVIPIILGLGSKYVTINLYNIEIFDKKAIDSFIKISSVVSRFDGKLVICEISDNIKPDFKNSNIFDYCFEARDELSALGVFAV